MTNTSEAPLFLQLRSRNSVLVGENEICKVLSFIGGFIDPDAPSLFQVANIYRSEIRHIHVAEVNGIVCTYEEKVQNLEP